MVESTSFERNDGSQVLYQEKCQKTRNVFSIPAANLSFRKKGLKKNHGLSGRGDESLAAYLDSMG